MKKVLILEPYYGGSHKNFLKGLQNNVKAEYTCFLLPARKWKMRMQLSAAWFVEQLQAIPRGERWFDTVLCSTFIDLAVFKALVCDLDGWNSNAKLCIYFHENQFVYPNQIEDKSVYQFTAINFNSALIADSLAFNSEFNRTTLLDGCRKYLKSASDMKMVEIVDEIKGKSEVLYPGIDLDRIDMVQEKKGSIPAIVWNHRWEHDKNPDVFFNALCDLKNRGLQFKLVVLGESFKYSPRSFSVAKEQLQEEILYFGYAESYEEYLRYLAMGTIVVSTSLHEFFGISIIEAVRAGCYPLLPKRLSYPELFEPEFLYDENSLLPRLETAVRENYRLGKAAGKKLTEKVNWKSLKAAYADWLFN